MQKKEPTVLLKAPQGRTLDENNYADFANSIMGGKEGRLQFQHLTSSKLRGIYGYITNVYTRVDAPEEFQKYRSEIQYLKVRMAYESGRDRDLKEFIEASYLLRALDEIKDYDQFRLYCRYAESLVAYFKFYGGRD